jgi:hypothetical protein
MSKATTRTIPRNACLASGSPMEFVDVTSDGDVRKYKFRMVGRSGEALDHHWWGRVVHDMSSLQHKPRIPIDHIHNDDQIIGYADEFDVSSGDLVVSGYLVSTKSGDIADEIHTKAKAGVPYEASINFAGPMTVREVTEGEEMELNKRTFTGPLTVIKNWILRGIAVCPYGYDHQTSTKFSTQAGDPVVAEVEQAALTNQPQEPIIMDTPAVQPAATEPAVAPQEPQPAQLAIDPVAAMKAELKRYTDQFGAVAGVEFFNNGKSFEQGLIDQNTQLKAEVTDLKNKLEAAKMGSVAPVSNNPQPDTAPKPQGFAGAIRVRK